MLTKDDIKKMYPHSTVLTLYEFCHDCIDGYISRYDGNGYFFDGEKETRVSVWDNKLTAEDVKQYPYIIWHNR